jgi:tryptophan-rich sensory protein
MFTRLVVFLVINFGALALGGYFTGKGVPSNWYMELNKAPWTPPGWFFGFAWTLIMICFSVYMAYLWPLLPKKNMIVFLFVLQFVLNVSWNPAFFYSHNILLGLIIISSLTLLMVYLFFSYFGVLKYRSFLILPYILWLIIATSLNLYILMKN